MKTLIHILAVLLATAFTGNSQVQILRSTMTFTSSAKSYVGQGLTKTYDNAEDPQHYFRAKGDGGSHFNIAVSYKEENWDLSIGAPEGKKLEIGKWYADSARMAKDHPSLDFSGCGRGNNQLLGSFIIRELEWGIDGFVSKVAVDFVQFDEGNEYAWIAGGFRYHSTMPAPDLEALKPKAPTK